jgi:DNA-binding response OmpR family regulator
MERIVVAVADFMQSAEVEAALNHEKYEVQAQRNLTLLQANLRAIPPVLLILDSRLASQNTADLCQRIRRHINHLQMPILLLADKSSQAEIADFLEAGADDVLRCPFQVSELIARTRALIWRRQPRRNTTLRLGDDNRTIWLNECPIELTKMEFYLLRTLVQAGGKPLLAEDLMRLVWAGKPGNDDTALVRNHIRNLRRKIEVDADHPQFVISHHGFGYALQIQHVELGPAPSRATAHH